jgi:Right handed beta helix region
MVARDGMTWGTVPLLTRTRAGYTEREARVKKALVLTIAVIGLTLPASASAQVARTWVSQSGSDSNGECQYATPCATFQKATEPLIEGGEINAETDGNFGPVTITKGLTIDGRGHSASITAFDTAVTINAPGQKVTLRSLHIQGYTDADAGIDIASAESVRLRDVTIRSMDGQGIDFRSAPAPSRLTVLDSSISEGNQQGIAVAPSASSSGGRTYKRVLVRNSDISANGLSGIRAYPAGTSNPLVIGVFDSTIADNGTNGIILEGDATMRARMAANVITGNQAYGIRALDKAQLLSYGNNRIFENGIDGAPTGVIGQN